MFDFSFKKILLLFLLSFGLFGQTKKMDLMKLPYDTLKRMYFDNTNDRFKQFEFAGALLAKAQKEKVNIQIARGYYLFSLLSEGNKSISCLDSVIKYSKNNTNPKFNFPALAYSDKAYVLKKQFKFKEAIDNFILAEKYAYKRNIDFYYRVRFSIAVLKSEELGDVSEALELYKECYNYYKDKDVRSTKYSFAYQDVLFGIADAYKTLGITDSASFYNRLGCKESKATNDDWYFQLFVLNEGANLVSQKKFFTAIDSINKALPKIIHYKDIGNTLAGYYYLGKANQGLRNFSEAAHYYVKVDSIYSKSKDISPEFMEGYHFLIDYYKQIGYQEKQFEFTNKLLIIDSVLNKNYKILTKKLHKEYDDPHLIFEKQSQIIALKDNISSSYWMIGILGLSILFISIACVYQYSLKKRYRSRFEKIINQTRSLQTEIPNLITSNEKLLANEISKETNLTFFEPSPIINNLDLKCIPTDADVLILDGKEKAQEVFNLNRKESIGISEEMINQILKRLEHFEFHEKYLLPNITVQNLSVEFETNSKYMSKIVNIYKGKSFVQYINDLRIEFAIISLQENKKLRKYTLQALSLEYGFNSAESFSSAFVKRTGIKPSYFIKQLDKE